MNQRSETVEQVKKARVVLWKLTKADGTVIEVPHEDGMRINCTLPDVQPPRYVFTQQGWILHDGIVGWERVRCEPCSSEGRFNDTLCPACVAAA